MSQESQPEENVPSAPGMISVQIVMAPKSRAEVYKMLPMSQR